MSVAHCTVLYTQYFLVVYVYFLLNVLVVKLKLKACNLHVVITKAHIICAITMQQAAPLSLYISKSGNFKANPYHISPAHWIVSFTKTSVLFFVVSYMLFICISTFKFHLL